MGEQEKSIENEGVLPAGREEVVAALINQPESAETNELVGRWIDLLQTEADKLESGRRDIFFNLELARLYRDGRLADYARDAYYDLLNLMENIGADDSEITAIDNERAEFERSLPQETGESW